MSIDYENITLEEFYAMPYSPQLEYVLLKELQAMPYPQRLEYAKYWQNLLNEGVELEWWNIGDNCWECYSAKVRVGYIYRRKTEPKDMKLLIFIMAI